MSDVSDFARGLVRDSPPWGPAPAPPTAARGLPGTCDFMKTSMDYAGGPYEWGPPQRVLTMQARVGTLRGAFPWHEKAEWEEGTMQTKEAARPAGISSQA